jgi:hypothetical protein
MNIKLSIIEAVSSFTRPPHLVFKALRIWVMGRQPFLGSDQLCWDWRWKLF